MNDVARINSLVNSIKGRYEKSQPACLSMSNLANLALYMNNDICERFLGQVFVLPYVPWREFNGLTINQMSHIFNEKEDRIRSWLQEFDSERVRVAASDLLRYVSHLERRPVSCSSQIPPVMIFGNGTRLDERGSSFYIYTPRAILYVAIHCSKFDSRCDKILTSLNDSVCRSDDWFISPDNVVITNPHSQRLRRNHGFKLCIDECDELTEKVVQLITTLQPGSKIEITVPA